MNYEDMSDFEINKLTAYVLDFNDGEDNYFDILPQLVPDFCNNPQDAWPIIIENKISISHSIALYRADALVYDERFDKGFKIFKQDSQLGDTSSRGALRAAMICFLKMKDAESE